MHSFLKALFLSFLCAASINVSSQTTPIPVDVSASFAENVGRIDRLDDLVKKSATTAEKKKHLKRLKAAPSNFVGRGHQEILRPDLAYHGPDVVAQTMPLQQTFELNFNIDGLTSGRSPNDPTGDIGLEHYLQAVNVTEIGVFDKSGNLISQFAANTLWVPLGFTSAGDPIILYDQLEERWIITEFPNQNELLVAVSETSDPLGAYNVFSFSTPSFPDYPKWSVWDDVISVTTNEGGAGTQHVYIIDKQPLLDGATTSPIQRLEFPGNLNTEAGFLVMTPVDLSGEARAGSPPIFMRLNDSSWGDAPEDAIEIYSVEVDFEDATNTVLNNQRLFVSPYDSYPCSITTGGQFPCIPQPGGSLDGIPEVIMNQVHYRNFGTHESMVLNFITDVDGNNLSGIRWMELRRVGGVANDWTVFQEGTFTQPDGLDRYIGSTAIDALGNIALAYNVSSENEFAGIRMTGRLATDPLGQMTVAEVTLAEGLSNNPGTRMGDYSQMTIDPSDGLTFWNTAEYASANSVIRTKITSFSLARFEVDLAPTSLVSPVGGSGLTTTEDVTIRVRNQGTQALTDYTLSYSLDGGPFISEQVSSNIASGEFFEHTFSTPADLEAFGLYNFELAVSVQNDDLIQNDTISTVVRHIAAKDAATFPSNPSKFACDSTTSIEVVVKNEGSTVLEDYVLNLELRGEVFSFPQTVNIDPRASVTIEETIGGLVQGDNIVSAYVTNLDGIDDEITQNDTSQTVITFDRNARSFSLEITFDRFPEETSWVIENENGVVFGQGSNFIVPSVTRSFPLCLPAGNCYSLRVLDAANDGLCCGFGVGFFQILDDAGAIVINNDGEFFDEVTEEFCVDEPCNLTLSASTTPTSTPGASDGAILADASNGNGPFTFALRGAAGSQTSPLFEGLAAGTYTVEVMDATMNCVSTITVEVLACVLGFDVTTVVPSSSTASDGSITVNPTGAFGSVSSFSLDGGTPQASNVFSGLGNGTFTVSIVDSAGCEASQTVVLDFASSDFTPVRNVSLEVFPNPTNGLFRVNVNGLNSKERNLPVTVFDATGKALYKSKVVWYDGNYTGSFSLYAFPAGTYYLRMEHPEVKQMLRVVKQ
jgi:hypothetical protein